MDPNVSSEEMWTRGRKEMIAKAWKDNMKSYWPAWLPNPFQLSNKLLIGLCSCELRMLCWSGLADREYQR